MQLLPLLALLGSTALALPNPAPESSLLQLYQATKNSENCKLPDPGVNCAGTARSDVIVQYGKADEAQRKMLKDVAMSSGSEIIHDWKDFGFSGFVPTPVVEMFRAHGAQFNLKVLDNACAEIPWCGEAPC